MKFVYNKRFRGRRVVVVLVSRPDRRRTRTSHWRAWRPQPLCTGSAGWVALRLDGQRGRRGPRPRTRRKPKQSDAREFRARGRAGTG
jgi:hypothetical protein